MYELLYIVPAIYTEDELKKIIEKIEALLKGEGVEILKSKNLGKLKFAYPIKKHSFGYYILLNLSAPKETLKKLDRVLQLESDILRFMLTRKIKETKEVKITEFQEIDPGAKTQPPRKKEPPRTGKEKIKLEDIEKKLDTLLEKEII
ncbi:30S ribosomal protein S6 [Patescibacteria group bacterium]